jgi:hypothetical protein
MRHPKYEGVFGNRIGNTVYSEVKHPRTNSSRIQLEPEELPLPPLPPPPRRQGPI